MRFQEDDPKRSELVQSETQSAQGSRQRPQRREYDGLEDAKTTERPCVRAGRSKRERGWPVTADCRLSLPSCKWRTKLVDCTARLLCCAVQCSAVQSNEKKTLHRGQFRVQLQKLGRRSNTGAVKARAGAWFSLSRRRMTSCRLAVRCLVRQRTPN